MAQPKKIDSGELLKRCINNDRRAQEQLFKKHFGSMLGMCLRYTSDKGEAASIVNQGFLRVFQKIHTFESKGSLEGWIRKLVFHALADHFKAKKRRGVFVGLEGKELVLDDANALDQCYLEDLLCFVEELPPATKEVFRLYALEGFTHPEIAKQVKISVGTSKWHLANARKLLKLIINKEEQLNIYAG